MGKAAQKVRNKLTAKRPLDFNFASDRDFANSTMVHLQEIFGIIKSEREVREEKWKEHYRAWTVDELHTDQIYEGRANLELPQIRKEVETMSRRIIKGLFPDNFLSAQSTRMENEDLTEVNAQVTEHYIANVMKSKTQFIPWIKQGVLYGTSPLRHFWRTDINEQFFRERFFVDGPGGNLVPKFRNVRKPVTLYDAPLVRAENMFNTFVYPTNISSPVDIQAVFYEAKSTFSQLKIKEKEGSAFGIDSIKDQGLDQTLDFNDKRDMLQQFGESGVLLAIGKDKLFDMLEIWLKLMLPGQDMPVPVVVEIINKTHVSRIQRNPYWHQTPPFDFMRFIIPPAGEYYGRGLPEASIKVQHQLNATLNQTMDSATLALNNVTIINPAFAPNAESFEVEPAAIWWADPNAVKQMQFPDLSQSGLINVGSLRTIITEMSDNSPQLPDPIAGKARSTGQAQLAVNEWQTDLFSFMESIGVEALNPFAKKIHIMLQQYLDDKRIVRVAGRNSPSWTDRVVTPEELVGNFDFTWQGSLQIENQSIKSQQMLNFFRILPQLPLQGEVKFQWANIIRRFLKDGIQLKDAEHMVESLRNDASTPPDVENTIAEQGGIIKVQPSDKDDIHIPSHNAFITKTKSKIARANMSRHVVEHQQQAKDKLFAAQLQQQQQDLALQLAVQGQNGGGPGNPGGNPVQIPETTNVDDQQRGLRA